MPKLLKIQFHPLLIPNFKTFNLFIGFFLVFFLSSSFLKARIPGSNKECLKDSLISKSLNFFLEQGFKNSPLLIENVNLFLSGTLDSAKIRAIQKPYISANSTAQFIPIINGYGYNQSISNGGNYLATLNLSQPLFNHFQIQTSLQGVQIRKDSLQNKGIISKVELKRNIINQYILAYADQKQITFQKDLLNLFLDQEEIFKKLVRKGIYKQSDYLNFLVSREAQEIILSQVIISFHNNLASLNQISGISDTITYHLDDPNIKVLELSPLKNTFQFHKFELDSLSLQQQKLAIKALYKPKIAWGADAGYESSNFDQFYKSFGVSIGLNFTLPIYDGHQRKISSKQIDLLENSRRAYLNTFKREYSREILSLQKQLLDLNRLENQLQQQIKNVELLVDIDRKLLNIGDVKITDLILAINNYKNTKFTLSQIEINRLTILNQLNFWSNEYSIN